MSSLIAMSPDTVSVSDAHAAGNAARTAMRSGNTSNDEENEEEDNNNDDEDEITTVQLPKMQLRGFMQEIAMKSGSTLVLTGFEQVVDTVNSSGIGEAKINLLGGRAYDKTRRDVMVILITPEVLESPLSAESRMREF